MGKRGPKTKFNSINIDQWKFLVSKGFKDSEISQFLGVSTVTLCNWKFKHKDFFNELADWEKTATIKVKKSLYERAIGYSHEAVKFMVVKGKIKQVNYIEHYPPDTEAIKVWLFNKLPNEFKQRVEFEGNVNFTIKELIENVHRATERNSGEMASISNN